MFDKLSGFSAQPPSFHLPDFSSMERRMSDRIKRFEQFFDSPDAVVSQLTRAFRPHEDTASPVAKPLEPATEADLKLLAKKSADR
ncbi:MAG: hypothetical protein HKM05_01095, partial [Spirochaetales bacterium]|nr:hypothetical protein [Spirochaetales bacterium]